MNHPTPKNTLLGNLLNSTSSLNQNNFFQLLPLDRDRDLPIIFRWVNQPYAIPFWGMNGTFQELLDAFGTMQLSSDTQSMVGYLKENLICQLDLYDPSTDPIHNHYSVQDGDLGIHLLMAPGKKPIKNFTAKILYLILNYLFTNSGIQRIIGEPDQQNEAANILLQKLSFEFHRPIQLPYKTANFYTITKAQFDNLPAAAFFALA